MEDLAPQEFSDPLLSLALRKICQKYFDPENLRFDKPQLTAISFEIFFFESSLRMQAGVVLARAAIS